MSGTSLDGIDLALIAFARINDKWTFKLESSDTYPYSEYWLNILKDLTQKSSGELDKIDQEFTLYLAKNILKFLDARKIENIDAVCSHGHTALHKPNLGITFQIGNRTELSKILNKTVVCDFRTQDVKYGGQGAPLVPIGDKLLFSKFDYCLNLGGFANISTDKKDIRIAYDICPVNIVLNYYTRSIGFDYDDKGNLAAKGNINIDLLNSLNSLDYFKLKPPKSLGLEWVESTVLPIIESAGLELNDTLRTFVEHIAIQISNCLNSDSSVLVTGGGTYNDFLIERLRSIANAKLVIPDDQLVEYKEAVIFGFLGVLKLRNEINCLSSVTGASKDHSSGVIYKV